MYTAVKMVSKITESTKLTQIWMEWMCINLIMCYLSFIIYKIIAQSRDHTNNATPINNYTETAIFASYDT